VVTRPGRGAEEPTGFLLVLAPAGGGNTPLLLDAPPVNFIIGLVAPKGIDLVVPPAAPGLYGIFTTVSVRLGHGTS
jgi:hypothetical protein